MKLVAAGLVLAIAAIGSANLVANPGFEDWSGVPNGSATFASWTQTVGTSWSNAYAQFPVQGMVDGGSYYLIGGNGAFSALAQVIPLPLDAAGGTFDLSAFLGGHGTQTDSAEINLTFFNGGLLGSTVTLTSDSGPWGPRAGATFRALTGTIPVGTTAALLSVEMTRRFGAINNGLVDNVSLTYTPVPEPASMAALGMGLAVWRRRSRQVRSV